MSCILNILNQIRFYIDYLIDYIFGLYWISHRKYITKPDNFLVLESATSLSQKIRKKEVSVEVVVNSFIQQIKNVNGLLNAVTDNRFDEAIEEAKDIDRRIASGSISDSDFDKKPFLGIPFTTKDSTICKGLKSTFGLVCRKDTVGEEDAVVVDLMKKAGGILLGVTNIPQLNLWQETINPVFGMTCNPYDTTRTVGGSSGGEASIIAACGSPIGIGTDIGGSIRIPSFSCGLFGHKPSNDLISTKGLTFRTGDEGPTMVTAGTMTKYAEDIVPFLKVLLSKSADQLKLDEVVNVADLNIFYTLECKDPKMSPLGKEMKTVIAKVINYFSKNATEPKELELNNLKYGGKLWSYWMMKEGYINIKKDFVDRKGEVSFFTELGKYILGKSDFTLPVFLNLISTMLPLADDDWAKKITEELRDYLTNKLGDNGVLLCPSAQWSARFHYSAILRPWNFYYFAFWNALKLPVTQVPLGLDSKGLPVGIQVVAGPNQDHLCIAVAKELEKAFGGYVPPFTTK